MAGEEEIIFCGRAHTEVLPLPPGTSGTRDLQCEPRSIFYHPLAYMVIIINSTRCATLRPFGLKEIKHEDARGS